MWQNWVNFALGIWLVIAAFIPGITASKSGSLWNDLIVGVLVAIFAFMAIGAKKAICWINAILGIWLVIAAFIPGIVGSKSGNLWNDLISGIIILIVGIYAALKKEEA
ncbi:SPW repeat protein [candidate division WOR-3 bacterium]|uniref:SPW repeat-containing integral membrane domain-containing protein n=1 Tax=candidate division TA06 bacterium TaxID=2250710 RepID=A0A660S7G6_UNCT6|nr:SPW repeat protein [candidate division WOR-3 bacterium]RKX66068.1 MAG: hypothetical protein DRP44_04890 [candidate division TA06 bacterium]